MYARHLVHPCGARRGFYRRFVAVTIGCLLVGSATGTTGTNCNTVPNPGGGGGGGNNGGVAPTILASDHILGPSNAKVTVVEYSDFECPFCGRFARSEFPTIKANYIDTNKVRWVMRHFPLRNIHPRAEPAARASECASDQGAFFEYHDLVFNTTDGSSSTILTDQQLAQHAVTLGLNTTDFNNCFPPGDGKAARVQQDVNSGTALGITGTPTFFVNNEMVSGFKTAAQMSEILDRKLAE
jgi:NhaA family Na+:H+ antiporter